MARKLRTLFAAVALATLVALGSASAEDSPGTIVDVAASNPDFSTLVTAVTEAGLVETLSGEGPFTVFAPTNEAFAALPEGQLDALLANKDQLVAVLTYHVVAGKLMAADVVALDSVTSVQGEPIAVAANADGVKVNDANVTATDIMASNGVIHVIDRVILPPSLGAAGTPSTSYALASVGDSGVSGSVTLDRFGPRTLVTLALRGTPAGGDHPAHLHLGDCSAMGAVVLPLDDVSGDTGLSSTLLDVPLDAIVGGDHALYVHLAQDRMSVVVACGEVGGGAPARPL